VGALEEVVKRARRHAALTVDGNTLVVQQTNLYGTRERGLQRSAVTDIRVGHTLEGRVANPHSRQAILDRTDPTWELHINLADGTIVRLLDGYGGAPVAGHRLASDTARPCGGSECAPCQRHFLSPPVTRHTYRFSGGTARIWARNRA